MRTLSLIILSSFVVFASSCGGGVSSDLDKKKEELAKIKGEIKELEKKQFNLEEEISILDTSKEESLIPVKVLSLEKAAFSNSVGIQGTVTSDRDVTMNSEIGGTVKSIYVKEGQRVTVGQTLLRIDGAQVSSQLAQLRNALELATTAFNKQKRLWDQKIGSEMQYLQAKNNKEDLENQINTVNAQAAKFVVRSPINGSVDRIFINAGEVAGPGSPLVQVVDTRKVQIEASVSENYIGKFKVGDAVTITYPALNITSEENISAVGQVIDPATRTFTLTITPKKNNKALKPNLLAIIDAADYKSESSITVATKLIRRDGDKRFVYVVIQDKDGAYIVEKRYIEIERSFSTSSVIKSGLSVGDRIIIEGYQAVLEKDEVLIVE